MFQSNFKLTVQFKRKDQLKFGICLDSYSTSHHSLCATWALRSMLACAGRECTHPRVDLLLVLETFTLNRTMHKRCTNLIHWKIGRTFSSGRWIGFQSPAREGSGRPAGALEQSRRGGILYIFRVIETLTIAQPMNRSPATYGPIGQR